VSSIDISGLNKAFESRVRLGIMSLLVVNESMDFNKMKELLQLTDGNLSSHAAALEKSGYILIEKEFRGKKPRTTYILTASGRKAFDGHLNYLEKLIGISSSTAGKASEAQKKNRKL
jgi:DNA-binding MarR family transcriptional regulator